MKEAGGTWTFSRIGGVDQVVIRNGGDIAGLGGLDQKLWAVLAMPTGQPAIKETLEYLDADKDGKIRVPDILRTIEELRQGLMNLDALFEGNDRLSANQVADGDLRDTLAKVLKINAGGGPSAGAGRGLEPVGLAAADKAIEAFSALPFNGDGVIVPASTGNDASRALLDALIAAGYTAADASGNPGADGPSLDRFASEMEAYNAWRGEADQYKGLFPDEDTAKKAADLFKTIRAPLDDYYRRCRVFAMANAPAAIGDLEARMAAVLSQNLPADAPELAQLPVAIPDPASVLHLDGPLHPTHRKAVLAFFAVAGGKPNPKSVAQGEWEDLAAKMDSYSAWLDRKPSPQACDVGRRVLDGEFSLVTVDALRKLIEQDLAKAEEAASLKKLRRLLLLKRDFLLILNNFVNLDNFYLKKKGIFQSGRLFLDARELEFCLDVRNPGAHGTMAGLASMYLIYCDLTRKDGKKKSIVAGLTAGDADNIFVGRNGIFYDADGDDWDAVITKIVVQPISIREAFFSPYKWLVKTLEELAMKRAASAEAANMDKMKVAASAAAQVGKPDAKPEQILPKKIDVGTVAAIGVALGSIGAMVTGILSIFIGMGAWMPLGIAGIFLLISGPSMILAYMKLRKRNIGPLLNAEGWAVNSRLKINVPFGGTLSHLATLPPGSKRQIKDPFAQKRRPWLLYFVIALIVVFAISWALGWLNPLLSSFGLK